MPAWNRKIDLRPAVEIFKATGDVPATAEKAVEIIEKSGWIEDTPYPDTLRDHIDRLRQATSQAQYEASFEYLYDVADADRVWIETF